VGTGNPRLRPWLQEQCSSPWNVRRTGGSLRSATVPIALVVEVCFHSARDNLHLTDLVGIGFLIPGRQLALNVGEPRGEQVTVTPDAARVVREGDRAVEFAFSCPVDLGNVAEHLSVGIVGAQPGLFREVFDSAWGQMAVCAVNHNAVPVGIVRGLNPESRRVRVRMAKPDCRRYPSRCSSRSDAR